MSAPIRYELLELGTETVTRNDAGFEARTWTWAPVPAERQSVSRSEFYAAAVAGYTPTRVYRLRACAYNGEPRVRDAGACVFKVIRSYDAGDFVELTCERVG